MDRLKKLAEHLLPSNTRCVNCHNAAVFTFDDSTSRFIVCRNQTCHQVVFQKYQNDLSRRKCKLQGCNKTCFVEDYGLVHDFCSRSHAQEYQKPQKQNQKQQQQQHYQQYYLKQQYLTYEKECKLPGCRKTCYSMHSLTHDFCCKSHADTYKMHHDQENQFYYGQQQRGNSPYHHCSQPQWALTEEIHFYNWDEPYYNFTNFASFPVEIDNKQWPTTEHYFQAQKFVGTPYEEAIRNLPFPREAFDFSRKPEVFRWRRADWDKVKDDVMYKALLAKFGQHEQLHLELLGTENRKLVEHTKNDSYWGDGGDGTGKNRLGELLMKVRRTLKAPKVVSPQSQPKPHKETVQLCSSPLSPSHSDDKNDNDDLMEVDYEPDNSAASKGSEVPISTPQDVEVDKLLTMPKEVKESFNTTMTTEYHDTGTVLPSPLVAEMDCPSACVTMPTSMSYTGPTSTTSYTTSDAQTNLTQPRVSDTDTTASKPESVDQPVHTATDDPTHVQTPTLGSLVSTAIPQTTSASSNGDVQHPDHDQENNIDDDDVEAMQT